MALFIYLLLGPLMLCHCGRGFMKTPSAILWPLCAIQAMELQTYPRPCVQFMQVFNYKLSFYQCCMRDDFYNQSDSKREANNTGHSKVVVSVRFPVSGI